jgi:predicted kinase
VREHTSFEHYLTLAERLQGARRFCCRDRPVRFGQADSGSDLAAALGGVRLRSDVERKRLFGLAPSARTHGAVYSDAANRLTYERLAQLAATVLGAGLPVVVDAASLKRSERRRVGDGAGELGAGAGLWSASRPTRSCANAMSACARQRAAMLPATEAVLERRTAGANHSMTKNARVPRSSTRQSIVVRWTASVVRWRHD